MPPPKTERYQADIISAFGLATGDSTLNVDDSAYDWRFLAEGDSWFSIGAIPSSNLLYQLRLKRRAVILNLGYPGDTIGNVSQFAANPEFARRLAHPKWASAWDAILLSGGGNDLIDRASDIIRRNRTGETGTDFIDAEKLEALKDDVRSAYDRIVGLRDSPGSPSAGKPIVVHTYSYPTPRPAPAHFFIVPLTRPWMHPVLEKQKVPKALRAEVAKDLLDGLADALLELQAKLPAFHVVDTRSLLWSAEIDAKGNSGDWLNEIHPNSDGYRKIAKRLAARLEAIL